MKCELSKRQEEQIETLIGERNKARKSNDFKRSDEIRDELLEKSILLKDTSDGTRWSLLLRRTI